MGVLGSQRRRLGFTACCISLAIGILGWLAASASASLELRADYQFQDTLTSTVGSPPPLAALGPGPQPFTTESVNGSLQTVLTFPAENGLQLMPTTGVIPNGDYTITVLFRFSTVTDRPWQRILDFQNGTSDRGLYSHWGVLELYPYARGSSATIQAERYVLVVLTRDSAGTVNGYVDGVKQFSYDDSSADATLIDTNNTLRFFRDNESGGAPGETSAGAVARIQLYDGALTAEQVANLPGRGSTGTAIASVGSLSFTAHPLGTLSAPRTVLISNAGNGSLSIKRVLMTGADPDDFLITRDGCSYITLATRESCSIGVRFAPSAKKTRTARLTALSTDPLSPVITIPLIGTGVSPSNAVVCPKYQRPKRVKHMRRKCAAKRRVRTHKEAGGRAGGRI